MHRYYIIVDGRVQGVGFRFRVSMLAADLKLTGWVRNLDNGMVEMEIQGTEENTNRFFQRLIGGEERFIRIDDYSVKDRPVDPHETEFRVRF